MTPEERAHEIRRQYPGVQFAHRAMVQQIHAAIEAEREACALLIDGRCAEVLARQYGTKDVYQFQNDVDAQIRMAAVLLPDLAAAIRARGKR